MDAVIVGAIRTPIGKYNKSLKDFSAPELGSLVIRDLINKFKDILKPEDYDEVIMGNVLTAGLGQAPARQAALRAGLPYDIGAVTINKVCGSGLKSVMLAAQAIRVGDAETIIAGGQESMSNVPYYLTKARFGYYYGSSQVIDGLEYDGLRDAYSGILMGMTGEIIAEKYKISREDADIFALRSHQLAIKARDNGWTDDEIVPVLSKQKNKDEKIIYDDGPRKESSLDALSKLKPSFKLDGIVTAGNASSINDGAAAVVVMSEKKKSRFRIKSFSYDKGICNKRCQTRFSYGGSNIWS